MTDYREKCMSEHGTDCEICGDGADVAHHIDGDRDNNAIDNLAPLCESCHKKVHSSPTNVKGWSEKLGTGHYLNYPTKENGENTTITVSKRALNRFNRLKDELDQSQELLPDHNTDQFLKVLLDTWEAADDGYYDNDAEAIANELKDEIDSLAFQGAVFDDEAREIIEKIDGIEGKIKDLQSQLPQDVAKEVSQR